MNENVKKLQVRRRELMGKLSDIKDAAEKRELNAEELANEKKLLREYETVCREI
jgi:hypothetical protein